MLKKLNRTQFALLAVAVLAGLLLLGYFAATLVFPAYGYKLMRDGIFWPFLVAAAVWFVVLTAWCWWACRRWRRMKKE